MGNITRRQATAGDAGWARRVHHAAVRDVVERQFGSWDEAQQDRFFDSDWTGGDFDIIEYRGVPCGYVCIEARPDDVHVREIDIDPAYQGRGIGTQVISSAIDLARTCGVPVVLGTLHENRAAVLYRRLGFLETGRTDTHTLFRLDPLRVVDAAGGLVWRESPNGVEVLLVHRPLRDDWTLPIGRRNPDEPLEDCAVREVCEETGYTCEIIRFLETLHVEVADGLHLFHIYEMRPHSGEFRSNPETDQAKWLQIGDAIERATYTNVQSLLRNAFADVP